jgi:hypothetical protein
LRKVSSAKSLAAITLPTRSAKAASSNSAAASTERARKPVRPRSTSASIDAVVAIASFPIVAIVSCPATGFTRINAG